MSPQNKNKFHLQFHHPPKNHSLRNANFNNTRHKFQTMFPESPTETFNKYAFIRKWIEEKALENGEGDFSLNYK